MNRYENMVPSYGLESSLISKKLAIGYIYRIYVCRLGYDVYVEIYPTASIISFVKVVIFHRV